MGKKESLQITTRKISELIPAEYNPRELSKEQFQHIKASLQRFGVVDPVIVNSHPDRQNIIIGGHQRVNVWREMGNSEIPCVHLSLTLDQEKELNIRLNKNVGEWDWDILADQFEVGDLCEWGFSKDELVGGFGEDEPEITEDELPEIQEEARTELGRIYQLGEHRLMCGDSTSEKDVARLMDGEKADMVFTDPPYALFGNATGVEGVVDDSMVRPFFKNIMQKAKQNTKIYGHIYMCCDWHSAFSIESCARDVELKAKNMCIWDKGDGGVGAMYQQCYEIVWFFDNSPTNKTTMRTVKAGVRTVNGVPNIWRFPRCTTEREHNAQKPVDMLKVPIRAGSDTGELILDLFGGSGTTLIACEQTNRKCRMMELDPKYCDVIVRRYANLVGADAEKIFETGVHNV